MAQKKVVNRLLIIVVILYLPAIGVCAPPAEQRADIDRCTSDPNSRHCLYRVRYKGTKEYEQPDTTSKLISNQAWGGAVQIAWSRAKDAPSGWLPTLHANRRDNFKSVLVGWIERKNLVRMDEFNRVHGCWPIASIEDGMGDEGFGTKMTPGGNALLDNKEQSYISFTPNLVFIMGRLVYGYDPKTHRLYNPHTGKEPEKVTYFPPEQLKGCDGLKFEKSY